jgi:hypothetical protein
VVVAISEEVVSVVAVRSLQEISVIVPNPNANINTFFIIV